MKSEPTPAPRTVDEYMAGVPPEFRPILQRLRKTIKAAAPDAEELISYRMPAYRQNGMLVYFGTYTGAKSKGVYVSRLDPASGTLTPPQLAAETSSPSFLRAV